MSNTDMRAKLTVTADASSVVVEYKKGAEAQREFKREVETTGAAVNRSARDQQNSLENLAAATARAITRQDELVTAEKRVVEQRRQVQTLEGWVANPRPGLDGAISSFFDAGAFRGAETAAESLRGAVSGLNTSLDASIEDMMASTIEARSYADALNEVRRAVSPLYAESQKYELALEAINEAERIGAATAIEAARARERAARGMAPAIPGQPMRDAPAGNVYAAAMREETERAARAMQALEESMDPVLRAQRELAQGQQVVNRAVKLGQTTNTEAARSLQQLEDRYQSVVRSQSPAAQSAMAMERAIEEETQAVRQLTLALDPAARAAAEMKGVQDQLTRAVRMGITTQEEAARMMSLLEARQRAVGAGGIAMGMGIQNASYQFTDILVQLQGGQALSLVLAQQLPQLLGGFGALGAVMGLAFAAGVPLVKMLFDMGDGARSLDDRMDALENALGRVNDRLKLLRDPNLSHTFGNMTDDVRSLTGVMLELDRAAQLKELRSTLDALFNEKVKAGLGQQLGELLTASRAAPARSVDELTRDNYAGLTGGRGPTYDQFQDRRAEIDALAKAGEVERVTKEITSLVKEFADGGPITDINADLGEILQGFAKVVQQTAQVEASYNGTAAAAQRWTETMEWARGLWDDAQQRGVEQLAMENERIRVAQNELAIAETVARFGKDSAEAEAERSRVARENYELELQREGIMGSNLDLLMQTYDQQNAVTAASDAWAATMARVNAQLAGAFSLLSSIGGGMVQRAGINAADAVLDAGGKAIDAEKARRRAEERTRLTNEANTAAGFMSPAMLDARLAEMDLQWAEEDAYAARLTAAQDRERAANRKTPGGGAGGGGGGGGRERSAASAGASIMEELARLKPSYENDVAAADAWRQKALEGLQKTKGGFAQFAGDVEEIYQERLKKAYEEDLKRRDDWASGVERGLLQVTDDLGTWADTAENLVTGWAKQGEDAFVRFGMTGKASIGDMVDFMLEQFLRLAFQQNIAPGMNILSGAVTSWAGNFFGGAGGSAPISTNHTGSPGVMRSYALGGYGDRMRQNEQLAMIRDGEEIMTSRALENASALISNLSAIASRSQAPAVLPVSAAPITMIVNDYAGAGVESEQTTDQRGSPTLTMTIGRQMAGAIAQPGNPAGKALSSKYAVRQKGIAR